jgi:hypothetical protein
MPLRIYATLIIILSLKNYFRATDTEEYFHLIDAGATVALSDDRESSLSLGASLLQRLGVSSETVDSLGVEIRRAFEVRDRDMLVHISIVFYCEERD